MSETISAIKLRLDVSQRHGDILDSQSKMCNWLYNHLLEKANQLRDEYRENQDDSIAKTLYTRLGLRDLVPDIKSEKPFLKTVHSSPSKNTALRLTDCIQTHQKSRKGKRKGKETGWPKFRAWGTKWFSLLYDEPNKGYKVIDNHLHLSLGMGEDRKHHSIVLPIKEAGILKDKQIRNLRLVKNAGIFYAVFTVVRQVPATKAIKRLLCIDPNHSNLGYGVDNFGEALEIESPHWLKAYDKRIDKLKAKRDRCQKKAYQVEVLDAKGISIGKKRMVPSRRWRYLDRVLKRVLAKRREQTKTYCYTISNQLCRWYDCIAVGDYAPKGGGITTSMRRSMNNRSLIGRFKETLSWVAFKSGKHFISYDETGTTRTCHACGHVVSDGIAPGISAWICSECKTHHHRDENAAINGMRKVLRNHQDLISAQALVLPGSGRVSISKHCAWRVRPSGVIMTPRGMDSSEAASAKKLNRLRGSDLPVFDHV